MRNRTTHFLTVSLALISAFCVVIFTVQALWINIMGARAITDIGIIYMSGMSEQIATHFGTAIELRLNQVEALIDSVPPPQYRGGTAMQETLAYNSQSKGFEYLAFYTEDGQFHMIYGPPIQSGLPGKFLKSLLDGEEKASAGWDSTGVAVVMLGVPAAYPLDGGQASIALVAAIPTSYLSDTLAINMDNPLVDVDYSIIRRDGSIILQRGNMDNGANYFDQVSHTYEELNGKGPGLYIAELTDAMDNGKDYTSQIQVAGQRQNLYCTGLPNSEWHLLLCMSYGILDKTISGLGVKWGIASLIGCLLILLFLLFIFLGYFRLTRQQIHDLDEARRTADKARLTAERASQVKSEFLSNISHDIRTPMNGIMGMTSVAIANLDNTPHVRSCLKKINVSSQHLLGLINDMLDMSKIEKGHLSLNTEPVSLREAIYNVMTIIQPQVHEKRQHLDIYTQDIICENVLSDTVRLTQVLLNLLSNAVKFTPTEGHIEVTLREEPSPKGEHYIRTHLYVRDDGAGINPEFQNDMFQAFVREDRARVQKTAGAGLGLTITKHIVDAMHGAIKVKSALGQGSEFHVILDLEKTHINELELLLPMRDILIAIHNERVIDAAAEMLESIGLRVDKATDGPQAVEMAKRRHSQGNSYHLILLDWKLPENTCIPTSQELHRLDSATPLLLLFDGDWGEVETEARLAGITGCIPKPLFRSALYYGLRKYAETESPQQAQSEREEWMDFTHRRVLMAEDNELNWEIASELLMDLNLQLEWAQDGQICVEKFQGSPPYWYDAILMDLRMPVMTGYEAASTIRNLEREDAKDIPIIAISADAFYDDIQRCLDCGMDAHAPKPIDIREVAHLLDQFIRQRDTRRKP